MTPLRLGVLVLAVAAALLSVWRLEDARSGIARAALAGAGSTPATVWRLPGAAPAPVVVIAHGFAGSRQLMEGFALVLARAGYIAVTFDYEGHGRNPQPMSGDVTRIDGTTERLIAEGARVAEAALALPGADGRLALVGHSMASDIVVRQALRDRGGVDVQRGGDRRGAAQPADHRRRVGADAGRRGAARAAAGRPGRGPWPDGGRPGSGHGAARGAGAGRRACRRAVRGDNPARDAGLA
jgi:hypothetical protein